VTISLLKTKLHIPPAHRALVSRPALFARLDEGVRAGYKLVLVSAPAGFGKTTLISDWVRALQRAPAPPRVAWLSLDGEDNDPARFWRYFVAALQTVFLCREAHVGDALLEGLQPPEGSPLVSPPPLNALLADLLNDLGEQLAHPLVLVLDDLHAIDEMSIHQGLAYFLEHLPEQVCLVACTRVDPPWLLARLRTRGQLLELRARELRFSASQVTAFLNEVSKLDLAAEDIATLNARTEGWIAGLQMAALSLREREDKTAFVQAFSGSHRFVLDYLVEEVLDRQPEDVQSFLLQTSILDRMSAPLCDAITARQNSQRVLEQLERDNLFVVPLDDERQWYRYHHLFADLLRRRLSAQPDLLPALHLAASRWLEGQDLIPDAISHALAAEDDARATALIETQIPDVFARGEFSQVQRWLELLPEERVRASSVLCVARAWTLRGSAPLETVEDWLHQAERALPGDATRLDQDVQAVVRSNIAVIWALDARSRSAPLETQMALLQRAQEVVPDHDLAMRSSIMAWLGLCHMDSGDERAAESAFVQAWQIGLAGKGHWAALVAVYARTIMARWHGQLHHAAALCQEALAAIVQPTQGSARRLAYGADLYTLLGCILLEWDDLEGAEHALSQGLDGRTPGGANEIVVKGRFALARLRLARGQVEAVPELQAASPEPAGSLLAFAATLEAWLCLMSVARAPEHPQAPTWWQRACHWAAHCQLLPVDQDWEIIAGLICALVRIAQYRADEIADLRPIFDYLDAQIELLEARDWIELLIQAEIVRAMALQATERERDALAALDRALELAAPGGYRRVFLDEGAPMMQLLALAARRGVGAARTFLCDGRESAQTQALPEPLSDRELDVLRLLDSELSRPQIAQELFVSANTVRTHMKRIYGKLGVHSRAGAVERARALGLL
jgi:LuxR family maltose regulon positive regulatory protein